MAEIFLPVLGFEGMYHVSNFARVKSLARLDASGKPRKERLLKPYYTEDGYLRVCFVRNGKPYHPQLHRVVFEAFHHAIPEGMEINHKNGVRDDNRPDNLECLTHADNIRYSKEQLGANYATYGNARMTPQQRERIFELRKMGHTYMQIAKDVGFSKSQVGNVLSKKCWDF